MAAAAGERTIESNRDGATYVGQPGCDKVWDYKRSGTTNSSPAWTAVGEEPVATHQEARRGESAINRRAVRW